MMQAFNFLSSIFFKDKQTGKTEPSGRRGLGWKDPINKMQNLGRMHGVEIEWVLLTSQGDKNDNLVGKEKASRSILNE